MPERDITPGAVLVTADAPPLSRRLVSAPEVMNTNDVHNWRLSNLPIFPTEEQCERYWHFMDTVKEKSYEFSKEEWEDEQITKISIYYDYTLEKMNMVTNYCERRLNTFYFKTEEDAQYIIDNFKDELMEFFIKER